MADNNFEEMAKDVLNTEDSTSEFSTDDINNNKVMAVLAYLGILFLIPLFAAKDSKYARFHTNQGIILCIASVALGIVCGILAVILGFIPFVGWIIAGLISGVVGLATTVLMILGIVNAATGKAKKLPLIGGLFTILK